MWNTRVAFRLELSCFTARIWKGVQPKATGPVSKSPSSTIAVRSKPSGNLPVSKKEPERLRSGSRRVIQEG